MVAEGRGGVCLPVPRQWRVMHSEQIQWRILVGEIMDKSDEQIQSRILVAEIMDKSDKKMTVLAAHFTDQLEERSSQWELLAKRSASFTGDVITLCHHNSLLLHHVEAHTPPSQELSNALAARDADLRLLQLTSLSDVYNHVHQRDAQDVEWQAPEEWT